MSFRLSTLMTAGLLGALMVLGSAAHAGDGCTKEKKTSAAATDSEPVETLGWSRIPS